LSSSSQNQFDSADLQLIAQYIVGITTLTGDDFLSANVNDSDTIDSADLQLVAQYLVGTITAFPGGMYIPQKNASLINSYKFGGYPPLGGPSVLSLLQPTSILPWL